MCATYVYTWIYMYTRVINHLHPLRHAAVDAGVLDVTRTAELVALLLDLHGQFSCGGHHKDDRAVAVLQVRLTRPSRPFNI